MPKFSYDNANISEEDSKVLIQDLRIIFEESFDTFYVADGKGITLRVSSSSKHIFGCNPEELIGKSIYQLENEGIFRPSATRLAIENQEKMISTQRTCTGLDLLVITVPIIEDGQVVRVINISKNITDINILKQELTDTKRRLLQHYEGIDKTDASDSKKFIYSSKIMCDLSEYVRRVAKFNTTVLITGESGVGKEVLVDIIHDFSYRLNGPLIKINCGAIPEQLLESELFGYEKGAFTGAIKAKLGLFQEANGGTLFLDEIGELPLSLQVKLLRVVQDKKCTRIGGTEPIQLDFRLIAATNRNLQEMVEKGLFRKDLYYRLNIVPVNVPPLRERPEDIVILTNYFLNSKMEKLGRNLVIPKDIMDILLAYDWPGNVRELENLIERLIITSREDVVTTKDLPQTLLKDNHVFSDTITINSIMLLEEAKMELERQLVELALNKYKTTTEAAKALGVSQSTISRKKKTIEEHNNS